MSHLKYLHTCSFVLATAGCTNIVLWFVPIYVQNSLCSEKSNTYLHTCFMDLFLFVCALCKSCDTRTSCNRSCKNLLILVQDHLKTPKLFTTNVFVCTTAFNCDIIHHITKIKQILLPVLIKGKSII